MWIVGFFSRVDIVVVTKPVGDGCDFLLRQVAELDVVPALEMPEVLRGIVANPATSC